MLFSDLAPGYGPKLPTTTMIIMMLVTATKNNEPTQLLRLYAVIALHASIALFTTDVQPGPCYFG
jgi:hypothetical protein